MAKAKKAQIEVPAPKKAEPVELPESQQEVKPVTLAGRSVTKYVANAQGKVKLGKRSTGKVFAMSVDIKIAERMARENPDIEIINA